MTPDQAEKFRYNILDLTKIWPHADYPLLPIGKIVLNKNPENYFAEVEQAGFAPSHLVPGIEPSADPVLQARLFAYPSSQSLSVRTPELVRYTAEATDPTAQNDGIRHYPTTGPSAQTSRQACNGCTVSPAAEYATPR